MKNLFPILFLFCFLHFNVNAQTDLSFYINQAKENSPLIKDNKNQSEASKVELERLKAFYTKPQITFNAGASVAPIINRDNGKNEFQISPSDATNYTGYDIAASNGGIYHVRLF